MKVHSLPISASDLPDRPIVESGRLERKAGWDSRSVIAQGADLEDSTLVGRVTLALGRLKEVHLLELTISDKPNRRNQPYRIADTGRQSLGGK